MVLEKKKGMRQKALIILVITSLFLGCVQSGGSDGNVAITSAQIDHSGSADVIRVPSTGGYVFGLEDVDPLVIGEDVAGWLDAQASKGIGLIAFEPLTSMAT